jgi:hypothetical protein
VRIGLVADIPDQDVVGRIEHMVQGDGQLDDAKPRPQMAAGLRDRIYGLGAEFVGELAKLSLGEGPRIRGRVNRVEKRCVRRHGERTCIVLRKSVASV